MNKAFEKILERLEEETKEYDERIERRKGACYFDETENIKKLDNRAKGIEQAISIVQEVAEEYKGGWIPCSERMPEEYGEYLIWWTDITGNQYYEITEYEPDYGWIGDIPQAVKGEYNVIAWQPLPEPYTEK